MAQTAKKYKCLYCNNRYSRNKLITHIDRVHEEMIPEGYTSTRLVFDMVNKNIDSCGHCRICGRPTKWSESAGRYNVICERESCRKKYKENLRNNIVRVNKTTAMLNDPDHQKEMMAGRKLSGRYEFKDGGSVGFMGNYEKKFLKFCDEFAEIPSWDISQGPVFEYEFEGKKRLYYSDFIYIPYNLVIEIKDGGEHPNVMRQKGGAWEDSGKKTIAKEKIFTENGEYNYVRITDNQFYQFIEVLMDMKYKILVKDTSRSIAINSFVGDISFEESAILEAFSESAQMVESATVLQELGMLERRNIRQLNNALNRYSYGYIVNGRVIQDFDLFCKYYRTIPVKVFEKYKVGVCWDYVNYESYWFSKNNVPHKCYFFIQNNEELATHTFLVYQDRGKYYYFESSWKDYAGIWEYNSLNDIFDDMVSRNLKLYKPDREIDESRRYWAIYEYFPFMSDHQWTCDEFMKYCGKSKLVAANNEEFAAKWFNSNIDHLLISVHEGTMFTESTIEEKANYPKPKKCKKCGSKEIGVYFQGEPIFKCKDCGAYLGTVGDSYKKLNEVTEEEYVYYEKPVVYFTSVCKPESIIKLLKKLDHDLPGKLAVKIHSIEDPKNKSALRPEFYKPVIDFLGDCTIVETNTAYKGNRHNTQSHLKHLKTIGWDKIAPVDILDATGEVALKVNNGNILDYNIIGDRTQNYDSMLVCSRFHNHDMGGFGGAIKNTSIGMASSNGKKQIHRVPQSEYVGFDNAGPQDEFLMAMADASKSIKDLFGSNIIYVNSLMNISAHCDCANGINPPIMKDLGILISEDPVAVDQASLDLIMNSKDKGKYEFLKNMNKRDGEDVLKYAERIGVGSREYDLVNIDAYMDESFIDWDYNDYLNEVSELMEEDHINDEIVFCVEVDLDRFCIIDEASRNTDIKGLGKCKISIYYKEGDNEPHVHINSIKDTYVAGRNKKFDGCIKLYEPDFFVHSKHKDTFNDLKGTNSKKAAESFNNFMSSKDKNTGMQMWEVYRDEWLKHHKDVRYLNSMDKPNYKKLV